MLCNFSGNLMKLNKIITGVVIGFIMIGCSFIPASRGECAYIYEGDGDFRDIGEYEAFLTAIENGIYTYEIESLSDPLLKNIDKLWKEEGVYREPKRVYFKVECHQSSAFPYGDKYPVPQSLSFILLFTIGSALVIICSCMLLVTRRGNEQKKEAQETNQATSRE